MNIIEKFRVEGLLGSTKNIEIKFDRQFNFLIGQNGTGKTTIINLLAAALLADFEKLDKTEFSKIIIKLKQIGGQRKPTIEVTKKLKEGLPYYDITYIIKPTADERLTFDLDAFAEERNYRGLPGRVARNQLYKQRFSDIQSQLKTLIDVRWLSIHRSNEDPRGPNERQFASSIDLKLDNLNNSLVRYFSKLSKSYTDQTLEFQKTSFLTLLKTENEGKLFEFTKQLNVDEERASLEKVFELLGVEKPQYQKLLRAHFQTLSEATSSIDEKRGVSMTLLGSIYNAWRAHSLVQEYKKLQEKRASIFRPKDDFLTTLNRMLSPRKKVEISPRNELLIKTSDGRDIPPSELSSGEKQLLIILGEALLQEGEAVLYIADEPELSLHVSWQEQLTGAVTFLNPAAQIVFATHSPDIVNIHTNKIIDMETL